MIVKRNIRGNKYRAIKTAVDGITFDSKKEAARYRELRLLEKTGEIAELKLQFHFKLSVNGQKIGIYRADFVYFDKKKKGRVVEDVKGVLTPLYKWKKKHMKAEHGIDILET